jgi:hypothetical protein
LWDRVYVVPERLENSHQTNGNILVQLDPHATLGMEGIGKSSSAEAAANAITA